MKQKQGSCLEGSYVELQGERQKRPDLTPWCQGESGRFTWGVVNEEKTVLVETICVKNFQRR